MGVAKHIILPTTLQESCSLVVTLFASTQKLILILDPSAKNTLVLASTLESTLMSMLIS
jgi:hypothetical protein